MTPHCHQESRLLRPALSSKVTLWSKMAARALAITSTFQAAEKRTHVLNIFGTSLKSHIKHLIPPMGHTLITWSYLATKEAGKYSLSLSVAMGFFY